MGQLAPVNLTMIALAQLERMKRFDRRFRIKSEPNRIGRYRVVYDDALGLEQVALRNFQELGRLEFQTLYNAAPWKRMQTAHDVVAAMDTHNEALREAENPDMQAVHENAWEEVQFRRGRKHLC